MKRANEKCFGFSILAASIAAIGFAAPLAWAAEADASAEEIKRLTRPDSEVEIGIGNASTGSFKFGDYGRGLEKSGGFLIGNIRMNGRSESNANYLEIVGRNLGLDGARDIRITGGEQGNYGLSIEYDELSKLHSDSFQTPYAGMGSTRLTQPAGWAGSIDVTPGGVINPPVAATIVNTTMMTRLAANMKRFDVETMRKGAGLSLTKLISGGWEVAVNFKREEKDGARLTGAPLQIGGGGSRGTLLVPEPINYTTDLFDALARYSGEKLQMQVAYHASLFSNANKSLVFDNLFYNAASTVGGNQLTGRLGQMPDNQFHQLKASGGYTLSQQTRLTGNLSFGRMTQNEAFLPYISTTGILPAPPVASLDGKINTTHADIKLHSKLSQTIKLTAGYKYDDRDNRTAVNRYAYDPADNTSAASYANAVNSQYVRKNSPLSKTQQVIYVDADFHVAKVTTLKLGFDYDHVKHTNEPTAGDKEATVKVEVKHKFSDIASGGVAYAYSNRNALDYNGSGPLNATYTAGYLSTQCVAPNTFLYNGIVTACVGVASATSKATFPFLDTPALRKFFLADRTRDKLNAFANIAPSEKLDLQLGASYYNEKYPDTAAGFGLTRATGWTANFDANLAATDKISGVFFASVGDYKTDQNGHNGASSATSPVITTLDRQNNTVAFDPLTGVTNRTARSQTLGLGIRVKPGGKYEWGGDFSHSTTTASTGFRDIGLRIAATVLPLPDELSRLSRLELFGKYRLKKDVALNMKYVFEQYRSTDWGYDGQTLTSSASFVGTGQTGPKYTVHVIGASLVYNFK
ncbi:MAG: MtrB/PioB family decaheme-associated outer membrane protein [Betaproteobacteria bacterium]|nr:MtrB/PioB family decaheme-associated outer membrane protein [Betaproteobacteria bacterium]